jgi:hypothetical protein
MTFNAKPNTYATDHAKITFAASYLAGIAQSHFASILEHDPRSLSLSNWDAFVSEFGGMFGIVNIEIYAEQFIRSMVMGERDNFATHIVRFEEYAFLCNWNYPALQSELYRSLPRRIKDILKTIPRPQHYLELRALCLQIDARYWEDEMENRRLFPRPLPPTPTQTRDHVAQTSRPAQGYNQSRPQPQNQTQRSNLFTSQPRATPQTSNMRNPPSASTVAPRPIQTRDTRPPPPGGTINREELERRRREGLCFNCGSKDHFTRECREKRVMVRATFAIDDDGAEVVESYEVVEDAEDFEGSGEGPVEQVEDDEGKGIATPILPGEV